MKRRIFSLIALLWTVNSHAYTECNLSIISFYTGDDGVPCTNGPAARGDITGIWLHK